MLKKIFLLLCSLAFVNVSYGSEIRCSVSAVIQVIHDNKCLESLHLVLTGLFENKRLFDINEINNKILPINKILSLYLDDNATINAISALIEHGANINKPDGMGALPIGFAIIQKKSSDIIRFLIQNNARLLCTEEALNPLCLIAQQSNTDILDIFFKEKPEEKNGILCFLFGMKKFDLIHFYEKKEIKLDDSNIPSAEDCYDEYLAWQAQQ